MRLTNALVLCLVAALPAAAEEISLKDGTKLVGHMTAISQDKIEVETSYGKVQLKRTDILSINFPENAPAPVADSNTARPEAAKVDESLQGVRYVNKTGKFTLTLPADWMINSDLHRNPGTLTFLSSRDKTRFLIVTQEEYPGSLESYKELALLSTRKNFTSFEELAQSNVTIDGKSALLVFYRAVPQKGLPLGFLSAFIQSGNIFTKVTVWCVDPLFHDMQPVFEKVVNSYHSTGQMTASAPGLPN
jgi:hypothetical protein